MVKIDLEQMMKKDGWILGFTEHCNVKYWSFRKNGFEIPMNQVNDICTLDDKDSRNFKKWRQSRFNLF